MTTAVLDQKAAFAERLKRIGTGQQFEHADVVGYQTQKAWNRKYGEKAKRPKRSFADRLMILIAFLCGAAAVLSGKLGYFYLSKLSGLPEAFYGLNGRGMALFALVMALILIVVFQLFTRGRLQSLALGCALMHFSEAAVAQTAPEFYAEIFSAEYVATVAHMSAGTPHS
ncbi:MAG: hypothetical protein R3D56_06610 [Paracoccaceae bacterium]|jgi:uncharacterized membrane protein